MSSADDQLRAASGDLKKSRGGIIGSKLNDRRGGRRVLRLRILRLTVLRLRILRLTVLRLRILRLTVLRLRILRLTVLRLRILRLTVLRWRLWSILRWCRTVDRWRWRQTLSHRRLGSDHSEQRQASKQQWMTHGSMLTASSHQRTLTVESVNTLNDL